jgi:hypothetical protein
VLCFSMRWYAAFQKTSVIHQNAGSLFFMFIMEKLFVHSELGPFYKRSLVLTWIRPIFKRVKDSYSERGGEEAFIIIS